MLKSHAPSRIGRRRSLKRQKTDAAGSDDDSSTAASRKAAAGRFAVASAPVVGGRLPIRAAVKVSINGEQPRQALRGWQEPRNENKMKATTTAVQKIGRRSLSRERTAGALSSSSNSSSSNSRVEATKPSHAASSTAAGLMRRVKAREQKRSTAALDSSSGDIEWRVPSPSSCSTKPPPPPPPPPPAITPPCARSVTDNSANGTTSNKTPSRVVRKSSTVTRASPRKKLGSSTSTAVAAVAAEHEAEEEQLPPCPYPGHQNVSWTCRACGGAKHHLTSRSAMEPLQRAHGFKVHRVPNDGDCFFSSIKAALPDGVAAERARGGEGGGAAAGAGSALTVRQMREWVAEDMGQDQLDFYILQAGANPEDRWLDFVRPLVDRIPSDDDEEEEEEEAEEDDDDSYQEETEGEASQSQPQQSTATSRKPPSSRSRPSRAAAAATAAPRTPKAAGSGGGGVTRGRGKVRTGSEQPEGKKSTSRRSAKADDTDAPEDSGCATLAAVVSPPLASSDRNARYLRRREGRGLSAAVATEATTKAAASTNKNPKAKSSSTQQRATAEAEAGSSSRRSSRSRKGKATSPRRVGEEGSGGDEEEKEEEEEEGGGEETEAVGWRWENEVEENEGLPVVETVEELRRFVRLEGSDVGHGNCMWADTHAHHVVSRRLKITILFVDMEREKRAWPYRVLARTVTDSDDEEDERFVVLKREPSHFVLLETVPSPEDSDGAVGSDSGGGGVAAKKKRKGGRGQACFSRSELPDVVRRLWQL